MQDDSKDRVMKWLTVVLLAVIVVGGLIATYPHFRDSQDLKAKKADIERQISMKRREIDKLRDNQRRFRSDPDFIEKIARMNHRVFPGEYVYIFEDK